MNGLFDSHCHLLNYGPGFKVNDLISQSEETGVSYLVCNGTSPNDWQSVLNLADGHDSVIPFIGLHPWFVDDASDDCLSELETLIGSNKCGIGEIGLDRIKSKVDIDRQIDAFRLQLDLARKYNRPVTIHCIKAWGQMMDILNGQEIIPKAFLLHAYSGSPDLVKPLATMGAYFTFSGTVLLDSYKKAREALLAVPEDRLLIESDSPYMIPPDPYRVKTLIDTDGNQLNHPANLPAILDGIASLLDKPADELREQLWLNSRRFFGTLLSDDRG